METLQGGFNHCMQSSPNNSKIPPSKFTEPGVTWDTWWLFLKGGLEHCGLCGGPFGLACMGHREALSMTEWAREEGARAVPRSHSGKRGGQDVPRNLANVTLHRPLQPPGSVKWARLSELSHRSWGLRNNVCQALCKTVHL